MRDVYKQCRLLYLVGQLGGGGSERQLWYLLQVMDRERYRPAVAVWNFSEKDVFVRRIRELDVPVYPLPVSSRLRKLIAVHRLIAGSGAEIVHSYTFYTNVAAYWATRGTDAVAVGSVRGEFGLQKKVSGMWLGRVSARWPRNQICNSLAAADACRTTLGMFAPRRVAVVRNGLDLLRLRSAPLPSGKRARIAGIGSLVPGKRWDRLCRAALELKRCGLDCRVQIAGDGTMRTVLEAQARELGVADRLELLGYTDDVAGVLAGANCLVHASDSEGCPNVVMEAMACGRPVVAMDVGDVSSLVTDGETGFVVPRGDEATFVTRILTVITDHALCRRMGEAARMKAEREFGLDRLLSDTLAAYRVMGWRDA